MTSPRQHRPAFTLSFRLIGGVAVVRVSGELDVLAAPALREHLRTAMRLSPARTVVVDVAEVSFCDSVGLSELVVALHRSQTSGARLVLSGVNGSLERLLYRTGLRKHFERYATWGEAAQAEGGATPIAHPG